MKAAVAARLAIFFVLVHKFCASSSSSELSLSSSSGFFCTLGGDKESLVNSVRKSYTVLVDSREDVEEEGDRRQIGLGSVKSPFLQGNRSSSDDDEEKGEL